MKNKNIMVVRNLIKCLELESLRNPEVVANLVRAFGIVCWGPPVFGKDEVFKNQSADMAGMYQTPDQIAEALVYLSNYEINSYCEVGIFQGGTFLFISEYLRRFNPAIKCLGIDPTGYLNEEIRAIIEKEIFMSFKAITSEQLTGQEFDLCFLDGDHSAEWVRADWENIGKHAKICMVHDIQEVSCPGVVSAWEEIKGKKPITFLTHTSEQPSQGIGIIHNEKKGKA